MKNFVKLNNGLTMPLVGYGTWQTKDEKLMETCLDAAFDAGYRHFDCAFTYANEHIIGKCIKKWIAAGKCTREDIFVTDKIPVFAMHPKRVEEYGRIILDNLGLDYVDMMLLHIPASVLPHPNGKEPLIVNGKAVPDTSHTFEEAWVALEGLVERGWAKSIGLSNLIPSQVERIVKIATIQPANVQVELNACYPKKELRKCCKVNNIAMTGFAPLGSPGRLPYYQKKNDGSHLKICVPPILESDIVAAVAQKHKKNPAQVLLRFLVQQGIAVVPKSVTESRIRSNIDIWDFELDQEDMTKLDTLDSGREGTWGFDWSNSCPGIVDHPEFQIEIIANKV